MKKVLSVLVVAFLFILGGCKEEILLPEMVNGEDGKSTIFSFGVIAPTDDHTNGGVMFNIGYDNNSSGSLDDEEILASAPIWHGNDGANGTDGTDGDNVTIGEDGYWYINGEKTNTKAVGEDGTNGTNGTDGADGHSPYIEDGYWWVWDVETNQFINTGELSQGEKGDTGADGLTPNILFINNDVSPTEDHTNGGILVTAIWDKNYDELITESEIIGMYTVWHGNDGADGDTPFINEDGYWQINEYVTVWKAQGEQGPTGPKGDKGDTGVDGFSPYVSESGYWVFMLNGVEIESTIPATGPQGPQGDKGDKGDVVGYTISTANECDGTSGYRITIDTDPIQWFEVCDGKMGETGLTGFQYLARTSEKEAGCFTIEFGLDINRNEVLDDEEVNDLQTQTVCDGLTTLFVMTPKIDGCFTIYSGLDTNYNGVLDRGEVNDDNTREVCDGISTLVEVDVDEEEGCVTVSYYYDDNYNGEIDDGDVFIDEYTVCNGEMGEGSLVTITPTDNEGCVLVETWIDANNNGEVDEGEELVDSATICDGEVGPAGPQGPAGPIGPQGIQGLPGDNGLNSLIRMCKITYGSNKGCTMIKVGLDLDDDGYLDSNEITQTTIVCDGEDGDVGNIKVDVCHKYWAGWRYKYKTLNISINALGAHLNNGDTLGACN